MFNQNTPLHNVYTSMTCTCAQCQQERNASTVILPHLTKLIPKVTITEVITFTAIDAETGARVTYNWSVQR